MWWLGHDIAEAAAATATVTPQPVRPEDYTVPKVGGTNDPMFDTLAELSDLTSPLAACRVLFATYDDWDQPVTPKALRDDLYDPCRGDHTAVEWTTPRGHSVDICRRCGCLMDIR